MKQITSMAKWFPAIAREIVANGSYSRQQVFTSSELTPADQQPFSALFRLTDDTMAGGATLSLGAETHALLVLMPVSGSIHVNDSKSGDWTVGTGQLILLPVNAGEQVNISNPFPAEPVNYLQWWFHTASWSAAATAAVSGFDVNKYPGCLVGISPSVMDLYQLPFYLSVGKFDRQQKTVHHLRDSRNGIFVLALSGIFEVQGRLLNTGDGLAIDQPAEIEAAALSSDAILLAVEIPFLIS